MKARLLLVIDEMEVGGTQRQMVHLVRGLDRERFEVEVAFFRHSSFLVDELKSMGVRVHEVPKRGAIDIGFVWALRRLFARGRFDLVHAFSFTSELWSAVVLATLLPPRRASLLSSIRGTYEWYSPNQWRLKRWVTRRSAAVIANSRVGAQYAAKQMTLDQNDISIVYNGLPAAPTAEPAARVALREALGIEGDTFLLLFVGRLVNHKNIETLLRAMAALGDSDSPQPGKPVQLVLAGDGPDRQILRDLGLSLGLEREGPGEARVQWLGERRDVAHLMDACDALVLPSWREGLSNVILEAMQAGKPVLASMAGGNAESVVAEETGLMFEPADAEALAAQIRRLVVDELLASRLGQAGRARAQELFTLENMASNTQSHYFSALRRAGKVIGTSDQAASA